MTRHQEVTHSFRIVVFQHITTVKKLPSDLDIFSRSTITIPSASSNSHTGHRAHRWTGQFLLVVREHQVRTAAVDIKVVTSCLQFIAEHSMCQPGRPAPQETASSVRPLSTFSTERSPSVAFVVDHVNARACLQLIEILRDSTPYVGSVGTSNITSPLSPHKRDL